MDPNANLKEQLDIARRILKVWDDCNADGTLTAGQRDFIADKSGRLAELVEALDGWMRTGGFCPVRWGVR